MELIDDIRPAAFYDSYQCINMKNWEGLSLGRHEIAKILENYPVGSLTALKRLERPEAEAPINYMNLHSLGTEVDGIPMK